MNILNSVEKYDPHTGHWTNVTPMATKRSGKTGQAPGAGGRAVRAAWAVGLQACRHWRPGKRGSAPLSSVSVLPKYSGIGDSPDSPWVRVRAEPPCFVFLYLSPSFHLGLQPSSVQW